MRNVNVGERAQRLRGTKGIVEALRKGGSGQLLGIWGEDPVASAVDPRPRVYPRRTVPSLRLRGFILVFSALKNKSPGVLLVVHLSELQSSFPPSFFLPLPPLLYTTDWYGPVPLLWDDIFSTSTLPCVKFLGC